MPHAIAIRMARGKMPISINVNIWAKRQPYTNSCQSSICHSTFIASDIFWVWFRWRWDWWCSFISSKYTHSSSFLSSSAQSTTHFNHNHLQLLARRREREWMKKRENNKRFSFSFWSRDLRCLRNTIHANLFLTYILAALLWISITLIYQVRRRTNCVCVSTSISHVVIQPGGHT